MKKKISRKAEREFEQRVIRDARGVMLNPLPDDRLRVIAEKKLAYALKRRGRIEGSYLHLCTRGSVLHTDPKWVYFNDQVRYLDRDWDTVEDW